MIVTILACIGAATVGVFVFFGVLIAGQAIARTACLSGEIEK